MNNLIQKLDEKNYIGFTIFDILHFLGSIALLIYLFINKPNDYKLYASECFVSIVFSVLLVAFIIRFAKKTQTTLDKKVDLTFAILVATSSLFVPETFFIAEYQDLPVGERMAEFVIFVISLVVLALAFIFFIIALFAVEKRKWGMFMMIGSLFLVCSCPLSIVYAILEENAAFVTIVKIIISTAPLFVFASVFAEKRFIKNHLD